MDGPALIRSLSVTADQPGGIFVQAKIDQDHWSLTQLIGSAGFYFIEVALTPYLNLRKSPVLDEFDRDPASFLRGRFELGEIDFGPLDREDNSQCQAVREIAGSSFKDDRFHLDPNCDSGTAHRRYQLWVDQMLAEDTNQFYIMTHGNQVMAFMVQRGTRLPLAGFAQSFTRSGLGDFFWLSTLSQMRRQKLSRVSTGISTNNTAILNLYARLGFRFRNPTAVFHYWSMPKVQVV